MSTRLDKTENIIKAKRIASNTMVLFIRMFAIMIINLYAVRIVLHALGETDYGIFNTVAGVVFLSTTISSTLALSVQRFYSYAIGQDDGQRLKDVFSASVNITILLAISIFIVFETIGLWFVSTQLTIPGPRMDATLWIYQFAIFSFVFGLLQIPSSAAIFAHEDMAIYAFVSLAECLCRLLVAYFISYADMDHLIFYGLGLLIVASGVFLAYTMTSRIRYPECLYRRITTTSIYKDLMSFSGWTMYGTLSGVAMIQGTTILLNIFFGPITNAAYAIANQIYNAANSLCNSIIIAFRPAMIKSYAEQSHTFLYKLFNASNKFILYVLLCVSIPALFELHTILTWWLGTVSSETVAFSRLFLFYLICVTLHHPITTIIQANGNIKSYYLWVETTTLMCLPVTWMLLRSGCPSYSAFLSMIGICAFAHAIRLFHLKKNFPVFTYSSYILSFILPSIAILVLSVTSTYIIHSHVSNRLIRLLVVFVSSPLITMLLVYFIGITKGEKQLFIAFIHQIKKG